jgi:hypothetical protein
MAFIWRGPRRQRCGRSIGRVPVRFRRKLGDGIEPRVWFGSGLESRFLEFVGISIQ